MPKFVFTYRQPTGYQRTPDTTQDWVSWFATMGDHLVDLGQPVGDRITVGTSDPTRTQLGGYSVIEAKDMDAAQALAEGCPHLRWGGGVEVGELTEIPVLTD